jgi:hypothetical protein
MDGIQLKCPRIPLGHYFFNKYIKYNHLMDNIWIVRNSILQNRFVRRGLPHLQTYYNVVYHRT